MRPRAASVTAGPGARAMTAPESLEKLSLKAPLNKIKSVTKLGGEATKVSYQPKVNI